jgi:hypothetical protein
MTKIFRDGTFTQSAANKFGATRPLNSLRRRSKLSSRAGIYCHMSTVCLFLGGVLTSLYKGSAGSALLSDEDDESRFNLWERRES